MAWSLADIEYHSYKKALTVTSGILIAAIIQTGLLGCCASSTDCTGGTCKCSIGFYNNSDDCEPAFNSECVAGNDCLDRSLSNSICTQGRCQCLPGFFYPNRTLRTNCFEAHGSTCMYHSECLPILSDSVCSSGKCSCKQGYYYVNHISGCMRVYNSTCVGDVDCKTRSQEDYYICKNRQCVCASLSYLNEDSLCTAVDRSTCSHHQQCISRHENFTCSLDSHQCHDVCTSIHCMNEAVCSNDIHTTIHGFRCQCGERFTGLLCSYPIESLVITTLDATYNSFDTTSLAFWDSCHDGLLDVMRYGLCSYNKTCTDTVTKFVNVKIDSIEQSNNLVTLRYVVTEGSVSRSATDVVRVIQSLSLSEVSQRLGYRISTAAVAYSTMENQDYCSVSWNFRTDHELPVESSDAFKQDMETRIAELVYETLSDSVASLQDVTVAIKHSTFVAQDMLKIVFMAIKEYTCLPAISVIRLISSLTVGEVVSVLGLIPASQPSLGYVNTFNSTLYYQNAVVVRTLMDSSRGESYFALHWWRLESGLSRAIHHAMSSYIHQLETKLYGAESRKKRSITVELLPQAKLLDVVRLKRDSGVVELIACVTVNGVLIPVDTVMQYMKYYPAEQVSLQLSEIVPQNENYMRAFDPRTLTVVTEPLGGHTASCIQSDDVLTGTVDHTEYLEFWTRTVLIIPAKVDIEDLTYLESKGTLLRYYFLTAFSRQLSSSHSNSTVTMTLPSLCIQLVSVKRLSYDTGHTEFIYYITADQKLVAATKLVTLSSFISLQETVLLLAEMADAQHLVEPYRLSTSSQESEVATSGTRFLVAFMENYVEADWPESSIALRLYFTTCSNEPAIVQIESPRSGDILPVERIFVYPDRENHFTIPDGMMKVGTGFSNKVVFISSDIPITVVAVNRDYLSADSSLILPMEKLSRSYTVATQWPGAVQSQIAITSANDTLITIQLPSGVIQDAVDLPGVLYQDDKVMLTLRAFTVLQLQLPHDLTGSIITSESADIAVFSGNIAASGSPSDNNALSRDHLYEQITPNSYAGTSYILVALLPELDHFPDTIKIISLTDNTFISIPNYNQTKWLRKAGDHWVTQFTDAAYSLYLISSKPISVFQITSSAKNVLGDPSLIQIPSLDRQSNYFSFIVPSTGYRNSQHFMFIHIQQTKINGLVLNEKKLTSLSSYDWRLVPHTYPTICSAVLNLIPGSYRFYHLDKQTYFTAYLYGRSIKESYFHVAGSCNSKYTAEYKKSTTELPLTTLSAKSEVACTTTIKFIPWPIETAPPLAPASTVPMTTSKPGVIWIDRLSSTASTQSSTTSTTVTTVTTPATNRNSLSTNTSTITTITTINETNTELSSPTKKSTPSTERTTPVHPVLNTTVVTDDYWVWFAVDGVFKKSEMELEANLLYLYETVRAREESADNSSQDILQRKEKKRYVESGDIEGCLLQVVKLERFFNYTSIVFYVTFESSETVEAGDLVHSFSYTTTEEMSSIMGLIVRTLVTAYKYPNGPDIGEAAEPPVRKSSSGSKSILMILFLSVGLLALVALVAILTIQRQSVKRLLRKAPDKDDDPMVMLASNESPETENKVDQLVLDGKGGTLNPEYPLMMTSTEVEQILAPYLYMDSRQSERYRNKALMKKSRQRQRKRVETGPRSKQSNMKAGSSTEELLPDEKEFHSSGKVSSNLNLASVNKTSSTVTVVSKESPSTKAIKSELNVKTKKRTSRSKQKQKRLVKPKGDLAFNDKKISSKNASVLLARNDDADITSAAVSVNSLPGSVE